MHQSLDELIVAARRAEDPGASERARVRLRLERHFTGAGSANATSHVVAVVCALGAALAAGDTAPLRSESADVRAPVSAAVRAPVSAVVAHEQRGTVLDDLTPRPTPPADDIAQSGAATEPARTAIAAEAHASTALARPTRRASAGARQVSPPGSAPSGGYDLAAESRALAEVQRTLIGGDARRALALLDQQEVEFSAGALAAERAAARVFALCQHGAAQAARELAEAFRQRYPKSPLAARVAATCVSSPAPASTSPAEQDSP